MSVKIFPNTKVPSNLNANNNESHYLKQITSTIIVTFSLQQVHKASLGYMST